MNLLAPVFKGLTRLRAKLYAENILNTVKLPVPVISIGNLTMGGTGKTPFTLWLLENYQEKYKIGIVVRSYKASLKQAQRVELGSSSHSEIFGDEAVLLQTKLPKTVVYSGPCKFASAQKLYENEKPDFIVVDDGFQHLKLKRNLDIVLLDVSVPLSDYGWPPLGRLREDFTALSRATIVVLTKTEMQNAQTYAFLKSQIPPSTLILESAQHCGNLRFVGGKKYSDLASFETNIFEVSSIKASSIEVNSFEAKSTKAKSIKPIDTTLHSEARSLNPNDFKNKKIFAFAGLARPENFRESLARINLPVQQFLALPDHVNYNGDLINDIASKAKNFDFCITTEKDAVKLGAWPPSATSLFVAPLQLAVNGNLELFYKKIDACFRGSY